MSRIGFPGLAYLIPAPPSVCLVVHSRGRRVYPDLKVTSSLFAAHRHAEGPGAGGQRRPSREQGALRHETRWWAEGGLLGIPRATPLKWAQPSYHFRVQGRCPGVEVLGASP